MTHVTTDIHPLNRTTNVAVFLPGTPLSLVYHSDVVPGYRRKTSLNVPLTGATLPPDLVEIRLELTVAGETVRESFEPSPNRRYRFSPFDGSAREEASVPFHVRVGYVFAGATSLPDPVRRTLDRLEASCATSKDGDLAADAPTADVARSQPDSDEHIVWTESSGTFHRPGTAVGLGVWSLDVLEELETVGLDGTTPDAASATTTGGAKEVPTADGRSLLTFDGDRHVETRDALLGRRQFRFEYDDRGLIAVHDVADARTEFVRDDDGRLVAVIASDGRRTTVETTPDGSLAALTFPTGGTVEIEYVGGGLVGGVTDERGNVVRFAYDEDGCVTSRTDGYGETLYVGESSDDRTVVRTVRPSLRESSHSLDRLATGERRYAVACCGDDPVVVEYDPEMGVRTVERPDGTIIRLRTAPDPRFGDDATYVAETEVETPGGRRTRRRTTRSVEYGADGETPTTYVTETDVDGRRSRTSFEVATRTLRTAVGSGGRQVYVFDEPGRLAEIRRVDGPAVELHYEDGSLERVADGEGARTTLVEGDGGRVDAIVGPLGGRVAFDYDDAGRVARRVAPDGAAVGYEYDPSGSVVAVVPPGRPAHRFEYAADRRAAYRPPGDGDDRTTYEYDADGLLTRVAIAGAADDAVTLERDDAGRVVRVTHADDEVTVDYAPGGVLRRVETAGGQTLVVDADGSVPLAYRWVGTVDGTVERLVDDHAQLEGVRVGDRTATFDYDADGLLVRAGEFRVDRNAVGAVTRATVGSLCEEMEYTPFGELARYVVREGASAAGDGDRAGDPTFAVEQSFDALGRVVDRRETVGAASVRSTFEYDAAGRLVSAAVGDRSTTYEYDENGNRVRTNASGDVTEAVYDERDRLVRAGAVSYEYGPAGRLTRAVGPDGETTYRYDALGGLRAVRLPHGARIEYALDGFGRRVGVSVDGDLVRGFLYGDGSAPVAELDGGGRLLSSFVYGTSPTTPDYLVREDRSYRILRDSLGSPRLVVDVDTGEVVQRLSYDPFGRVVEDTSPGFQPFGFAGGLYDYQTGLVRFGARDYDPRIGRWTAPDPLLFDGGDANLYAYVRNDPVNCVDPSGLWVVGKGLQVTVQVLGGGELTLHHVVDGHGNHGYVLSTAWRYGLDASLSADPNVFYVWDADTIYDLTKEGYSIAGLDIVEISGGLILSPGNEPIGVEVGGGGPGPSVGQYAGRGSSTMLWSFDADTKTSPATSLEDCLGGSLHGNPMIPPLLL